MERWTTEKSAELYGIDAWGAGYFRINQSGNIAVHPDGTNDLSLDLHDAVNQLVRRGIDLPVILRFDGIIRNQIKRINKAFHSAIQEYGYKNRYRLAYPIKVNQQRHVVDAIRNTGREYGIALEVGSKPELLAVLTIHDAEDSLLLCNGYKDTEYIELALLGRKLGRRSIIIIEQLYEVEMVLEAAKKLGIEPELGLRMKPSARGAGKWEASGGENAKFGLSTFEIIKAIEMLKEAGKLDWIKLLHFHVGSQVSSIVAIKRVLREGTRMYAEIAKLCPSLCFFDVGGGLGVDYDGSRTNFESSMDYSVDEYARDVVWAISNACQTDGISHPEILSESGRATVAHHSVLVASVTDVSPGIATASLEAPPKEFNKLVHDLYWVHEQLNVKNCQEGLHDAIGLREVILNAFLQGEISLHERAYSDALFKLVISKAKGCASELRYVPEEFQKIDNLLRDLYFCNFSLFQSIPDSWAIGQLFPVMPIHRHSEEPTRNAFIADLTCDSDGKIDKFTDLRDVKSSLPLHEFSYDTPYLLGVFLIGAYQEILGDLHNLFGDTNAVHLGVSEDGQLELLEVVEGDTVREVLQYVQWEPQELLERLRTSMEGLVRTNRLSPEESAQITRRIRQAFEGYTYLVV